MKPHQNTTFGNALVKRLLYLKKFKACSDVFGDCRTNGLLEPNGVEECASICEKPKDSKNPMKTISQAHAQIRNGFISFAMVRKKLIFLNNNFRNK